MIVYQQKKTLNSKYVVETSINHCKNDEEDVWRVYCTKKPLPNNKIQQIYFWMNIILERKKFIYHTTFETVE